MSLAHEFLAKSDWRNASLSAQEVLRSDSSNLEAARVMAQIADASRLPTALAWRSRVVELDPHSLADRLALAQIALTMRDSEDATSALEGVDPEDKKTAGYQNAAGELAAAANNPAEAVMHFLEASRLDPQNLSPQVNLAVVRLHGTNTLELGEARTVLQRLAANQTNSALRCQALRELTLDAVSHKHEDVALSLSKRLIQETNSVFTDWIMRLNVLLETRNADLRPSLTICQREAASNPSRIYDLAAWEMAKISPRETLDWVRSLPISTQTNQPTTLMIAECYDASKDWRALQVWLTNQTWTELEFLRHALLCRSLRGQELTGSSREEWTAALQSANNQKQRLLILLRLAKEWSWHSEQADLLWMIVNRYPLEKWASRALTQALFEGGQTRSLMRLFKQELERAPADLVAKNNLAMIALLLDAKELKPLDLAREVYQQAPTNSSFAAIYAFSLYTQGKSAEALKVMQQIKPQDLDAPSIAGYYGIILRATGGGASSGIYLKKASKGTLLPEERKLVERANIGS